MPSCSTALTEEDLKRYLRHLHGDDIQVLAPNARKFERMVQRLERDGDVAALQQLATRITSGSDHRYRTVARTGFVPALGNVRIRDLKCRCKRTFTANDFDIDDVENVVMLTCSACHDRPLEIEMRG